MPSNAAGRVQRGRRPRLTRQVIEDICASLRTAAPIKAACEYVYIDDQTYRNWLMTAVSALAKHPRQRSQHERLCIDFRAKTQQAQAAGMMLTHTTIASAAGMGRDLPKRRRTEQIVVADDDNEVRLDENGQVIGGRVIRIRTTEEELAPNWRAAAHIGRYRFPQEMGAVEPADDDSPALKRVTDDELIRALEQARAQVEEDDDEAEDAELVDVPAITTGGSTPEER